MNIYLQTIRGDSLILTDVQYLPLTIVDLCECLSCRLTRSSGTSSSHYRHGLPGDDRHRRPLGHHPGEADLLGNGFSSNVLVCLHNRLDHHQCSNHCMQHCTNEASRRCRISGWNIAQLRPKYGSRLRWHC